MSKFILIAVAGGAGSLMRYAVAGWAQRLTNGAFPVGTLLVNILGSFVLGLILAATTGRFVIREDYRIGLTVGLLGGFTTFSTFSYETFALFNDGQWARAAVNMISSVVLAVTAAWMGYRLGEIWLGA